MSGANSIDAVKKKIRVLQEQAAEAMERAERLQKEVEKERRAREEVHLYKMVVVVGVRHEEEMSGMLLAGSSPACCLSVFVFC